MFSHFHQHIEACLQQNDVPTAKTALFGALGHSQLHQDALLWLGIAGLRTQHSWLASAALASLATTSQAPNTFALLTEALPTHAGKLAASEEAYYLAPHETPTLLRLIKQRQADPASAASVAELLKHHVPTIRDPKALETLAPAIANAWGSLCGSVWWQEGKLCGWCLTEATQQAPELILAVGNSRHTLSLKRYQPLKSATGSALYAWWFSLTLENTGAAPVHASVTLAGAQSTLYGSPARPTGSVPPRLGASTKKPTALTPGKQVPTAAPVTVLVPVYEGYEETLACLHSVVASRTHHQTPFELLIVNDASPNQALVEALESFANTHHATLLHQPTNQGFINTVNRGLAHSAHHDVILLNADTLVHGDWVDRLQASAYQHANTASVTPLTNNGELMSLLGPCNPADALTPVQLAALDNAAAKANQDLDDASVAINTGCGFCLYLRHDALAALGGLDPALTRGYGEESDWSYRAEAHHWQHRGALNVVVAHQGGISFGSEKRLRVKQNLVIIEQRYPHSSQAFDTCLQQDPMREGRERAVRHWLYHQPLASLWPGTHGSTEPSPTDSASISVWPSQAHALRAAQQHGCAMALVGQTLTLRGECPHPWQLCYRLPAEQQRCQQDLNALGITTLTAATEAMKHTLSALLPAMPNALATSTGAFDLAVSAPASSERAPIIQFVADDADTALDASSGGLLIVLGEPKSLEQPAFIAWASQLARQQSSLYLLHGSPTRANHPLASSGQLYPFMLPRLQRRERIELLIQHLPLSGLLLLDTTATTLTDAHWLHGMRPLPIWSAPGVSSTEYALPVTELRDYPAPSEHSNAQGVLA
tara:strand:+ start:19846 stop:22332 length:2487 start_codon:yes stop_codon:yes gene_type:complete